MSTRPENPTEMLAQIVFDIRDSLAAPPSSDHAPPDERGWTDVGEVMSNFDHEIEPGADERLRSGGCFGGYAAWDFHGTVWFEDGKFHCYVKQYRSHVATISGASLRAIMDACSERFGAG